MSLSDQWTETQEEDLNIDWDGLNLNWLHDDEEPFKSPHEKGGGSSWPPKPPQSRGSTPIFRGGQEDGGHSLPNHQKTVTILLKLQRNDSGPPWMSVMDPLGGGLVPLSLGVLSLVLLCLFTLICYKKTRRKKSYTLKNIQDVESIDKIIKRTEKGTTEQQINSRDRSDSSPDADGITILLPFDKNFKFGFSDDLKGFSTNQLLQSDASSETSRNRTEIEKNAVLKKENHFQSCTSLNLTIEIKDNFSNESNSKYKTLPKS